MREVRWWDVVEEVPFALHDADLIAAVGGTDHDPETDRLEIDWANTYTDREKKCLRVTVRRLRATFKDEPSMSSRKAA